MGEKAGFTAEGNSSSFFNNNVFLGSESAKQLQILFITHFREFIRKYRLLRIDSIQYILGSQSGYESTGSKNIFLGYSSGSTASGESNIFLGNESGIITTGSDNIFLGHNSGKNNLSGSKNIFIGSGDSNRGVAFNNLGSSNISIGYDSLSTNRDGEYNLT